MEPDFFTAQWIPHELFQDMACAFTWEHSLRGDLQQTPPFYSLVHEETSHPTISAIPDVSHNTAQQHTRGNSILASGLAPEIQLRARSFAAGSPRSPNSLCSISAAQAKCYESYRLDDVRQCMQHRECKTVADAMHMPGIQICVNQKVPNIGHWSTRARNNSTLNHRGCTEENLEYLSPMILRDASALLSATLVFLDESIAFNRDWTTWDMMCFTHILIEESEITCEWGACGDRLRVKQIKTHLTLKHGVKSNLKSYSCSWNGCSSRESTTQLSSLARHIQERHCSMYWPCPTCERRFTREETLSRHFEKCPGRNGLQVGPQDEVAPGRGFAYMP